MCYQPSPVKPQQGSSCPVSPLPVEGDRVRFKGKWKLYSLIREWRDASSPCSTHSLQQADRPWAWLLYGDLVEGAGCVGGVLTGQAQMCCSWHSFVSVPGAAPLHSAHHRHLGLRCRTQRLCTRLELRCRVLPFCSGNSAEVLGVRSLLAGPYEQVELD